MIQRTGRVSKALVAATVAAVLGGLINDIEGALIGSLIGAAAVVVFGIQWQWITTAAVSKSRPVHAVALGVGLLVLILMDEVAGLLEFMRLEGDPVRGIGFLTGTTSGSDLIEAVGSYQQFDQREIGTRDARSVVWLFVVLDSVLFIWSYGMVLRRGVQRRLEKGGLGGVPVTGSAKRLVEAASFGIPLVLAADWMENLAVGALVEEAWARDSARSVTWVLIVVSTAMLWLKWTLIVAGGAAVIAARIMTGEPFFGRGEATIREATNRLRPLVVVYVALVVVLFQPLQVSDLMLRLGDIGWPTLFAVLAVFVLAVTLWTWGRYLQANKPQMLEVARDETLCVVGGALAGIAGILSVFAGWHWIAAFPGVAIGLAGLGGLWFGEAGSEPDDAPEAAEGEDTVGAKYLPAVLAAGSMMLVGAAMMRAGVADAYFFESASAARSVFFVGVAVFTTGALLPRSLGRFLAPNRDGGAHLSNVTNRLPRVSVERAAKSSLWANTAIGTLAFVALWRWPIVTGRSIGALALVLLFLSLVTAVSGALVRWADAYRPPTIFRLLRLRRTPIFAVVGLWLLLGQVFLDRTDHDVRSGISFESAGAIDSCEGEPPPNPTIGEAWEWWKETNALNGEGDGGGTGYPLIMIAASGGGIRAAWWTAAVMGELVPEIGEACIDNPPGSFEGRQVFAASGVSGGSLGLATHQAALLGAVPIDDTANWVDARLGEDHLSSALSWFAYVEMPRSLLGFPYGEDRARVMELSWEEPWDDAGPGLSRGLRAGWSVAPQLPLLALNGASVNDGCRVLISVLEIGTNADDCRTEQSAAAFAETYATNDFLCEGEDLRLSTAALLSARFPIISPAGRLVTCDGESSIEVVDGGYRDSNGAETAVDLWRRLAPLVDAHNNDQQSTNCVVPVYVLIEDDFRLPGPSATGGSWPPLLAPVEAVLSAWGSASGEANFVIQTEVPQERRVRIGPTASPGAHPALGWSLSSTTLEKMAEQISNGGAVHPEIQRLHDLVADIRSTPCAELLS